MQPDATQAERVSVKRQLLVDTMELLGRACRGDKLTPQQFAETEALIEHALGLTEPWPDDAAPAPPAEPPAAGEELPTWLTDLIDLSYDAEGEILYSVNRHGEGATGNPRFHLSMYELKNTLIALRERIKLRAATDAEREVELRANHDRLSNWIAEGLRLAEAATPGPWVTNETPLPGSTANGVFTSPPDDAPEIFVCSVKPRWDQGCAVGDEAIANANFIAAARTLLPAALTELKSLRQQLAALGDKWRESAKRRFKTIGDEAHAEGLDKAADDLDAILAQTGGEL